MFGTQLAPRPGGKVGCLKLATRATFPEKNMDHATLTDTLFQALQARQKPGFADGVTIHATIAFTWTDRLRILFGRPLHQRFTVPCENAVGQTGDVEGDSWVAPLWESRPALVESTQ